MQFLSNFFPIFARDQKKIQRDFQTKIPKILLVKMQSGGAIWQHWSAVTLFCAGNDE